MLNYDEESFEFDGYSIYKNDDVSKYRVWEQDESKDVKIEESKEWISKIDINQFTNLVSSVESLKGELVAVNTYD
jgi:hypothetical protein